MYKCSSRLMFTNISSGCDSRGLYQQLAMSLLSSHWHLFGSFSGILFEFGTAKVTQGKHARALSGQLRALQLLKVSASLD